MANRPWNEVGDHFHRLVEMGSDKREHYLADVEPSLRDELRSLLACHSDASRFLEQPVVTFSDDPIEFSPGESYRHFHIDKLVGAGSFGKVYLAFDSSLGRQVALKVGPDLGQEARTMAPLDHQNIVRVHSETVWEEKRARVICMQYVPGTTLDRLLGTVASPATGHEVLEALDTISSGTERFDSSLLKDRETLEGYSYTQTVLWWTIRIAQALAYAHRQGVLHLDIKPANILMNPYGTPLLTDFNVSQSTLATAAPTPQSPIGGTWKYMAPEHRALFESGGKLGRVDRRSDIFSLGVLIREMMGNRKVPEGLVRVIERATHPEPQKRFVSAEDLAAALEGCLETEGLATRLPSLGKVGRFCQRHPIASLAICALAPQLMGSAINITYNSLRIMAFLTPSQQTAFHNFCVGYNLLVYPACMFIVILKAWPLVKGIRSDRFEDRTLLLRFPQWLVIATTLGWMPGSILFPLFLHQFSGPVGVEVFGHFFVSFTLSWLVALTYSLLGALFLSLRLWYPKAWLGEENIHRQARRELAPTEGLLRAFPYMAALVPLTGAILIVVTGSGADSPAIFRLLTGSLIVLGMVGAGIALRYTQVMEQTLAALTGRS